MSIVDILPKDLLRIICHYLSDQDLKDLSLLDDNDIFWKERFQYASKKKDVIKPNYKFMYDMFVDHASGGTKLYENFGILKDYIRMRRWGCYSADTLVEDMINNETFLTEAINSKDKNSHTMLSYLCYENQHPHREEYIKKLISYGADVNTKAHDSVSTVIMKDGLAITDDDVNVLRMLLEAGADVNKEYRRGERPLYYAQKKNNKEMIDLLIKYGATL